MTREFRLPDIGEGLTEAGIVRWLIPEGESVEEDQPVVEVETDKAVVEIPSPYAGIVIRHGGVEGDTIEVGEVLVVIGDDTSESAEIPSASPSGRSTSEVGAVSSAGTLADASPGADKVASDEEEEAVTAAPIVGVSLKRQRISARAPQHPTPLRNGR